LHYWWHLYHHWDKRTISPTAKLWRTWWSWANVAFRQRWPYEHLPPPCGMAVSREWSTRRDFELRKPVWIQHFGSSLFEHRSLLHHRYPQLYEFIPKSQTETDQ
jgi:hypothetical protein